MLSILLAFILFTSVIQNVHPFVAYPLLAPKLIKKEFTVKPYIRLFAAIAIALSVATIAPQLVAQPVAHAATLAVHSFDGGCDNSCVDNSNPCPTPKVGAPAHRVHDGTEACAYHVDTGKMVHLTNRSGWLLTCDPGFRPGFVTELNARFWCRRATLRYWSVYGDYVGMTDVQMVCQQTSNENRYEDTRNINDIFLAFNHSCGSRLPAWCNWMAQTGRSALANKQGTKN